MEYIYDNYGLYKTIHSETKELFIVIQERYTCFKYVIQ